jgi:hypothetical protein
MNDRKDVGTRALTDPTFRPAPAQDHARLALLLRQHDVAAPRRQPQSNGKESSAPGKRLAAAVVMTQRARLAGMVA